MDYKLFTGPYFIFTAKIIESFLYKQKPTN